MKIDKMPTVQRQLLTLMQLEACPILCRLLTSGVSMAGDAGIRPSESGPTGDIKLSACESRISSSSLLPKASSRYFNVKLINI